MGSGPHSHFALWDCLGALAVRTFHWPLYYEGVGQVGEEGVLVPGIELLLAFRGTSTALGSAEARGFCSDTPLPVGPPLVRHLPNLAQQQGVQLLCSSLFFFSLQDASS